jgi:hypothetical protein
VITNIKLHEKLLKLAAVVVKSVDNERLRIRVINSAQILAIIKKAVLRDEEACKLYLKFRHSSILHFTFAMAEVGLINGHFSESIAKKPGNKI